MLNDVKAKHQYLDFSIIIAIHFILTEYSPHDNCRRRNGIEIETMIKCGTKQNEANAYNSAKKSHFDTKL